MPTIIELRNCKIQMFADDHVPPHFHIFGADSNCIVDIATLEIIRGTCDKRDLDDALKWAVENMDVLQAKWTEFNERD